MHGGQRAHQDESPAPASKVKRRRALWFEYLKPIPLRWSLVLGAAVWVIFFGLWELAAAKGWVNTLFMPPPHRVLSTLYTMIAERGLSLRYRHQHLSHRRRASCSPAPSPFRSAC